MAEAAEPAPAPAPTPRRLLLVIHRLTPAGGAEVQLAHLARGLAANGHRVTLCCVDRSLVAPATVAGWGVELVELGAAGRLARALAVPRLARLARRAELVHCTMWDASLWGRLAAILARRPVIVADHTTDRSIQVATSGAPRADWIARHNRLLDRFTFTTVACAESQRPVLEAEGVSPARIVCIPNGVPIAAMRAQAAASPGRAALGLPPSGPLVLQVGVLRPEKNQRGALELFGRVREAVPEAQLVLVGDGPLRGAVEARAAALGAAGWAHFLGHRDDVPALLAEAALALLPSTADAMPMVVLESMALGVPVVASEVGDVRRVLGDAGLYAAPGDGEGLAAHCVALLREPALRERLRERALARVERYDFAAMVTAYEDLFEAAIAGRYSR